MSILLDQRDNVIKASEINTNLNGFGISFTETPLDVDRNQLTDIGIGKYISTLCIPITYYGTN